MTGGLAGFLEFCQDNLSRGFFFFLEEEAKLSRMKLNEKQIFQ